MTRIFFNSTSPQPQPTFLTLIAQEEFAKAFLLALTCRRIIPWSPYVLRACRDHRCKHLLCIVMDYLRPEDDEFLERCNAVVLRGETPRFPRKVADAIKILRHEKIGRWESQSWVWAEAPHYDRDAKRIAEGDLDSRKQDALYVRLGADGSLARAPKGVTPETLERETERAKRFAGLIVDLLDDEPRPGLNYDDVEQVFRMVFTE